MQVKRNPNVIHFSKASRKKPKRCKAAKTLPLGHFYNAFLIGTNAEIQTKRNPKTFKIQNLAVKKALNQLNLLVKPAETCAN